jgi:hypothetical protein
VETLPQIVCAGINHNSINLGEGEPHTLLPAVFILADYRRESRQYSRVPGAFIRRATGLSYAYCKCIRRGDVVPHVAHWAALRAILAR